MALHAWSSAHYVIALPDGHRFPIAKYGLLRDMVIAEGVVAAAREVSLHVPLVVRLEGTNVELGKKILAESGLAITAADNLEDAAEKVVAAMREAK